MAAPRRQRAAVAISFALALMLLLLGVGTAPDAQAQEDTVVVTITHEAPGAPGPASFFDFEFGNSFDLFDGESFDLVVPAGSFLSLESFDPAGYAATGLECVGAEEANLFPDPIGNFIDIFVADVDVDCVYTSSPIAMVDVTFIKSAPESDGADLFDFFISDSFALDFWEFTLSDGASTTIQVPANEVIFVEELGLDGWILADISCDTADTFPFGPYSWDVYVGSANATCTVTNERTAATEVTITKRVVGFEGPATFEWFDYQDFDMRSIGPNETTTYQVTQNQTFQIDEYLEPGWVGDSIICDGGATAADITDIVGLAFITIQVADAPVSCEVTNRYEEPSTTTLTITKAVDGPATLDLFDFSVLGEVATLGEGESATFEVAPFESLFVTEFANPTWQAVDMVCTGADGFLLWGFPGYAEFEVAMGDGPAECTVTNAESATVDLTVIHSSPLAPEPVSYFVSDEGGLGGDAFLADGEGAILGVVAGSFIDVIIQNPAGQQLADVDCVGAEVFDIFTDPFESYVFMTVADEPATCAFVFGPGPTLRITKAIDGPDDGQAFSFGGSQGTFTLRGGESVDLPIFDSIAWVTESRQPGWELVSIECDADPVNWSTYIAPVDEPFEAGFVDVFFDPGTERIECVFTNRATAGVVSVGATSPTAGEPSLQLAGPDGAWTAALDEYREFSSTEPAMSAFSIDLSGAPQWTVVDVECTEGLAATDLSLAPSGRSGTFTVETGPGLNGSCTWIVDLRACSSNGQGASAATPPRCRNAG